MHAAQLQSSGLADGFPASLARAYLYMGEGFELLRPLSIYTDLHWKALGFI
jgi:hypothetical protein